MGLSNTKYNEIMREYEQRRLNRNYLQTEHLHEVYRKIPEYKADRKSVV